MASLRGAALNCVDLSLLARNLRRWRSSGGSLVSTRSTRAAFSATRVRSLRSLWSVGPYVTGDSGHGVCADHAMLVVQARVQGGDAPLVGIGSAGFRPVSLCPVRGCRRAA